MANRGQFAVANRGQFALADGGQFEQIFHLPISFAEDTEKDENVR
jgi:hypothetical protein